MAVNSAIWNPLFAGIKAKKREIRRELIRLQGQNRKGFRKREAARARIRNMEATA